MHQKSLLGLDYIDYINNIFLWLFYGAGQSIDKISMVFIPSLQNISFSLTLFQIEAQFKFEAPVFIGKSEVISY